MSAPRARLPLVLRDLSAGAAFTSMAISGALPVWALGMFALGLALALAGQRLFARRGTFAAVGVAVSAIVLYASVATGGLDLVIASCTLAGLISLHRILSEPAPKTDNQVHLTSLLMIAGGAALSGDLLFGVCLFAYAVLVSFAVGLSVVEQAMPEGEPLPVRASLSPLAVGVACAMAGSVVFFVLFPRLSWNVAARGPVGGLAGAATAGFSDRIRLSGDGSIKTNPRVVLKATLEPDPGRERLDAYWVGRTFDTFDGREWVPSRSPLAPAVQVELHPGLFDRRSVKQLIELLPAYGSATLVALETPARFSNARTSGGASNRRVAMTEVPGEEVRMAASASSFSYHAQSLREGTGPATARERALRQSLLQLPPSLDPRVAALARSVVGLANGETEVEPLQAARKLEAFLKREYAYTLELSDAESPLTDFLFVRKAGHCEHFATALAVMLRTLGIPARVAAGFFGGERVDGGGYVVRAGDAHAWVHVLTESQGLVSLDATPEAHRSARPTAWMEWLTRRYEQLEGMWRSTVLEYSIWDQFNLVRGLLRPSVAERSSQEKPTHIPLRAWLTAACLGVLAWLSWLRLARRLARPREHEATRFLEAVERVLSRAGLQRRPSEALEPLARRLAQEGHPLAEELSAVSRRYLEARFGQRPFLPQERERLLAELEAALRRQPVHAAA